VAAAAALASAFAFAFFSAKHEKYPKVSERNTIAWNRSHADELVFASGEGTHQSTISSTHHTLLEVLTWLAVTWCYDLRGAGAYLVQNMA
jgi:hypothetical protein